MHARGFGHGFFLSPAVWTILVIIFLVIVALLVIRSLRNMRAEKTQRQELNEQQLQTLEEFEAQVMALLTQNGKPMQQTEIGKRLGLPVDLLAARLKGMEECGEISRRWSADDYTYSVEKNV
jgi:DNA-binding MarR family transcriptional regulator